MYGWACVCVCVCVLCMVGRVCVCVLCMRRYGAPPPLFCAPRSKIPRAPKWSTAGWCDPKQSPKMIAKFSDFIDYVNVKVG